MAATSGRAARRLARFRVRAHRSDRRGCRGDLAAAGRPPPDVEEEEVLMDQAGQPDSRPVPERQNGSGVEKCRRHHHGRRGGGAIQALILTRSCRRGPIYRRLPTSDRQVGVDGGSQHHTAQQAPRPQTTSSKITIRNTVVLPLAVTTPRMT